jgi:hypothetical protein
MPDTALVNPEDVVEIDRDAQNEAYRYRVDLGSAAYDEQELDYFAAKIQQGDFSYEGFLPESVWLRNDWAGGEGRVRWEKGFLRRCEKSLCADIRFRQQIIKRQLVQTASVPQSASCAGFVQFLGDTYAAAGKYVYKSTNGGLTWSEVKDNSSGTATAIHVTSDYAGTDGPVLLIAYGDGTPYLYSNDGSSFTASGRTSDDNFATDFANLKNRVWRLFQATDRETTEVSNTTDPDNAGAGWGGAVKIPNSNALAHHLRTFENAIVVSKEDGLHSIQSDGTATHIVDFRDVADPVTGQAITIHDNVLWFNNEGRIFAYNGTVAAAQGAMSSFDPLGPDQADWDDGDATGIPIAMMSASGFLWVAMLAENGNYIIKTFNSTAQAEAGVRGAGWSTFADLGATVITSLGWDPNDGSNPSLLIGTSTGILYVVMPDGVLNPLADQSGNIKYGTTDDDLYMEDYDAGLPDISKGFLQAELDIVNDTNTSALILYSIDGAASFSELGETDQSGHITIDFPGETAGKRVQVLLRLKTSNTAQTPVVRSFTLRFELRPRRRMMWIIPLILSAGADPDHFHGQSIGDQRAQVYAARDNLTPIHFRDIWGVAHEAWVEKILSLKVAHDTTGQGGSGGSYEARLTIRVKEHQGAATGTWDVLADTQADWDDASSLTWAEATVLNP